MTKNTKPKGLEALAALLTSPAAKARLEKIKATADDGTRYFTSQLPDLKTIGVDGRDHVNVSVENTNALGWALSKLDPTPYYDKLLKMHVCSISGYLNFLRIGGGNLALLSDPSASRATTKVYHQGIIDEMPALIVWGLWQKISSNEDIRIILRDLAVPIDAYIVRDGRKQRTRDSAVYALGLMEIRKALQERRYPAIYKFLTRDAWETISEKAPAERMNATITHLREVLTPVHEAMEAQRQEKAKAKAKKAKAKTKPTKANPQNTEQSMQAEQTPMRDALKGNESQVPALAPITNSDELEAAIANGTAGVVVLGKGATPAAESIANDDLQAMMHEAADRAGDAFEAPAQTETATAASLPTEQMMHAVVEQAGGN